VRSEWWRQCATGAGEVVDVRVLTPDLKHRVGLGWPRLTGVAEVARDDDGDGRGGATAREHKEGRRCCLKGWKK